MVEFFLGDDDLSRDRSLRVSRYLGEHPHVRFSVWRAGRDSHEHATAEAVVALSDAEAARLARFLDDSTPPPRRPPSLLERIYYWRVKQLASRQAQQSPTPADQVPCGRSSE